MVNIEKKIRESVTWNAVESITYQILLGAHQCLLYLYSGQHHYGLIGTAFALIYLTATITVGGFELAITPLFNELRSNRVMFKRIIFTSLLKQMCIMSIIGSILLVTVPGLKLPSLSSSVIMLAAFTALSEGIRKVFRTVLYLFFRSRTVAWVEITLLTLYCSSVWIGYHYLHDLPLMLIVMPLFFTSLISLIIYGIAIYKEYKSIPLGHTSSLPSMRSRFIQSRIINALNTIGHITCSGNFLIPLFSALQGLEVAGLFKLISYWCQTATPIIQKVFGVSSQALFAEIKKLSLSEKRAIFFWFNTHLIKLLAVLLGSLVITAFTIHTLGMLNINSMPWTLISLFVLLLLSENIMIVYEKFCIAEEKSAYLLLCQIFSLTGWLIGGYSGLLTRPTIILAWLIGTRLLSCWLLAVLVRKMLRLPTTQESLFTSELPTSAGKVDGIVNFKNNATVAQQ